MSRLSLVVEGWIAANACDALEVQRIGRKLGFDSKAYDYFYKPLLVQASEELGFDWKKVDNGIWVNRKGGTPLTPEEINEELP